MHAHRMTGKIGVVFITLVWCFSSDAMTAEPSPQIPAAHFHHTRINTVDPATSIQFYETVFGAKSLPYRGHPNAVLVDRAFILFNTVNEPPARELGSALYHIGWGCKDTVAEYEWARKHNVQIETPATTIGNQMYMYAFGPSGELFEFYSGIPQPRFAHVHLIADDVPGTVKWYMENLGLSGPKKMPPPAPPAPENYKINRQNPVGAFQYMQTSAVSTANDILINIFLRPGNGNFNWWTHEIDPPKRLLPSKGRALDHIAFSFSDIEPVRDRMKENGVEIADDIKVRSDFGFKSFVVLGPDNVTIEIVEEKPIPEGIWESFIEE